MLPSKVPKKLVLQNRLPRTSSQDSKGQVPEIKSPRRASQARLPGEVPKKGFGSQAKFPATSSKARFRSRVPKQGLKNRFPAKFRWTSFRPLSSNAICSILQLKSPILMVFANLLKLKSQIRRCSQHFATEILNLENPCIDFERKNVLWTVCSTFVASGANMKEGSLSGWFSCLGHKTVGRNSQPMPPNRQSLMKAIGVRTFP
jgi:hypothetical protein